jgi:rhodanese-related sulfurtransferase
VADELGYRNINDYRGGIKEWAEKGLPVEGATARSG